MSEAERCPDCGSTFTIDPDAEMDVEIHPGFHNPAHALRTIAIKVKAAFCNGCERVIVLEDWVHEA